LMPTAKHPTIEAVPKKPAQLGSEKAKTEHRSA
jgi:hypothetical protein